MNKTESKCLKTQGENMSRNVMSKKALQSRLIVPLMSSVIPSADSIKLGDLLENDSRMLARQNSVNSVGTSGRKLQTCSPGEAKVNKTPSVRRSFVNKTETKRGSLVIESEDLSARPHHRPAPSIPTDVRV